MRTLAAAVIIGVMVGCLPLSVKADAAEEDYEVQFRAAASCAAYAFIQTRDYPETIRVFQEGNEPTSEAERERAEEGLRWTNRALVSRGIVGHTYEVLTGKIATNVIVSEVQGDWVETLNQSTYQEREMINENCRDQYNFADEYCGNNSCMLS